MMRIIIDDGRGESQLASDPVEKPRQIIAKNSTLSS